MIGQNPSSGTIFTISRHNLLILFERKLDYSAEVTISKLTIKLHFIEEKFNNSVFCSEEFLTITRNLLYRDFTVSSLDCMPLMIVFDGLEKTFS